MNTIQSKAANEHVLVRTPKLPVAAALSRLHLIRTAESMIATSTKVGDVIKIGRVIDDLPFTSMLHQYDWCVSTNKGYDDTVTQWEYGTHLLSLSLDDKIGWQEAAMMALKETVVGGGWRFLKAYSMQIFYADRSLDDHITASKRPADKLQVST